MPLLVNLAVFGALGWWINAWAGAWLDSLALFTRLGDWWILRALQTLLHWLMSLVLFFSLAFAFTGLPWVTWAVGDFGVKVAVAMVMLVPFRLLMPSLKPA